MVVSPDGSIRECEIDQNTNTYRLGNIVAAVEVKCPFPKAENVALHYTLPKYYVCQCLAEMHVLGTDKLIYISWSPESSVVLEVTYDAALFEKIIHVVTCIYGKDEPKRTSDTSDYSKRIKEDVSRFVASNVKFVAEVPSAKMCVENGKRSSSTDNPYHFPLH